MDSLLKLQLENVELQLQIVALEGRLNLKNTTHSGMMFENGNRMQKAEEAILYLLEDFRDLGATYLDEKTREHLEARMSFFSLNTRIEIRRYFDDEDTNRAEDNEPDLMGDDSRDYPSKDSYR